MIPPGPLSECISDERVAVTLKRQIAAAAWHPLGLNKGNFEDRVDEIYQQVCATALSKAANGGFKGSNAIAWLMRIATFVIMSHKRDRARALGRTTSEGAIGPQEWEAALAIDMSSDDRIEEIFEAVDKLKPRQREAFILRHVEQLTGRDLALSLGVSTGSAAAMASSAKKKIIDRLKSKQGEGVVQ